MSRSGSEEDSKAISLLDALFEEACATSAAEIRENIEASGGDPKEVAAEMRAMALDLVRKSRMAQVAKTTRPLQQVMTSEASVGDDSSTWIKEQLRQLTRMESTHDERGHASQVRGEIHSLLAGACYDPLATSPPPGNVRTRDDAIDCARVRQEAAHWHGISTNDQMSSSEKREFLAWLRQSPENIRELLQIHRLTYARPRQTVWLGRKRKTQRNTSDIATPETPEARPRVFNGVIDIARKYITMQRHELRLKLGGAIAASLLVGGVVAYYYSVDSNRVVSTDASEWHTLTLRDGTTVHLDARTTFKVEYTDEKRGVYLERGGAVLEVSADATRPFVVHTSMVDVTAIGTRFGVSIASDVTVTVSEGVVKVTGRGRSDGKTVTLKAGEQLRAADGYLTSPRLAQVDAERNLQWAKDRRLNLGGMTVAEGAEEFNRRNRVQIVVDSPTLATHVIDAATVRADAPERYAKAIAAEPGVKMTVDEKNGVIRLSN